MHDKKREEFFFFYIDYIARRVGLISGIKRYAGLASAR